MKDTLISVVIPTRNRHLELASCLAAFKHQKLENFEVVIFDNSDPELKHLTKSVAENCGIKQAKYHSSPVALAMTDSWENALMSANGDYLTIIGDDDTVMHHGLDLIKNLVIRHPEQIINWQPPWYYWPNCPSRPLANTFRLPASGERLRFFSSRVLLQKVCSFQEEFTALPTIYTSLVPRKLYEKAVGLFGRFFHTRSPDVGTAFLLGSLSERYLRSPLPFFIAGISGKSNGAASVAGNLEPSASGTSPPDQVIDFINLSKKSKLDYHPYFDGLPVTYAFEVASSAMIISDLLQSKDVRSSKFKIDLKVALLRGCQQINEMPEADRQIAWDKILAWGASKEKHVLEFSRSGVDLAKKKGFMSAGDHKTKPALHGWIPSHSRFIGRLSEEQATNVSDFAKFAASLYCYEDIISSGQLPKCLETDSSKKSWVKQKMKQALMLCQQQ